MVAAAIETAQGDGRGASTITQQLVRARLLPADVVEPGGDLYLRKAKEVIQSARLTRRSRARPASSRSSPPTSTRSSTATTRTGSRPRPQVYFGVSDLAKLTPAQAALLAALPQSPSTLDPYRFAEEDDEGRAGRARDRARGRAPQLDPPEPVDQPLDEAERRRGPGRDRGAGRPASATGRSIWRAPHFMWQVRQPAGDDPRLGGRGRDRRLPRHHDARLAGAAARRATASRRPSSPRTSSAPAPSGCSTASRSRGRTAAGSTRLRGKDLHNAALVAIDYRTGDVRAYVGSGGYYRDSLASRRFNPKYDAAGVGTRQPGSAWKPILYATAFERRALTPGSLLLDITTEFAPAADWAPKDADQLDRGPVLVRDALQMSLNVPGDPGARAGGQRGGREARRRSSGIRFAGGEKAFLQAGLAGAIGTVEVRPLDLVSAFGTLANGGVRMPPRMVLEIQDPTGKTVWKAPATQGRAGDLARRPPTS